eukprot:365733-Chlamydomonas_euryale.AAC.36
MHALLDCNWLWKIPVGGTWKPAGAGGCPAGGGGGTEGTQVLRVGMLTLGEAGCVRGPAAAMASPTGRGPGPPFAPCAPQLDPQSLQSATARQTQQQ